VKEKRYILLYHGVTDTPSTGIENFSKKHLNAQEFEMQMKFIKENMNPTTLRKIVSEERLRENSVAITFDDTFENVATVALPIMKKYNIPGTFFITTGFIDTDRLFWVDKLEHIINSTSKDQVIINFPERKKFSLSTHNEKINAVVEIKEIIKSSKQKIYKRILDDIEAQLGSFSHQSVKNYKNLSSRLVRKLDNPPMYEVGGHTVNHEILSQLNKNELDYEIGESINCLKTITGREIDLFSYPEGQENHYNEDVIMAMKKHGVKICPTAISGHNGPKTSKYELKRIMVGFNV
jgi:peptidoglycan/xylan/chitin deacetylase (PgdA/CDA1 family)